MCRIHKEAVLEADAKDNRERVDEVAREQKRQKPTNPNYVQNMKCLEKRWDVMKNDVVRPR